ncbi:MAG: AAA family ATPase [Leptospira sp.]|nr:AAA family ATPase [Leptospira sp.]
MSNNIQIELYTESLIEDLEASKNLGTLKEFITRLLHQILISQQSGNLAIDWNEIEDKPISWEEISKLNISFLVFQEINSQKLIYLQKTFSQKKILEDKISSLIHFKWKDNNYDLIRIKKSIQILENQIQLQNPKFILNDEQKNAILSCISNPFHIISGGPGTGKTTIVAFIIKVLEEIGELPGLDQIALAAPTGRAAQRLTESIQNSLQILNSDSSSKNSSKDQLGLSDLRGQTIHSLLVTKRYLNGFYYNRERYLPQRLIFIDETSMVDLDMMISLLEALPPDGIKYRIILIGDPNQLPSVDKGAVINDLINSLKSFSNLVTHLTISNRQQKQANGQISKIQSTAEEIIKISSNKKEREKLSDLDLPLFNSIINLPLSLHIDHFPLIKSLLNDKENVEQIARIFIEKSKTVNYRDGLLKKLWNEIFLNQIEEITKWNILNYEQLNSSDIYFKFHEIINQFRCLTVFRKGYYGVEGLNAGIEILAKKDLYPMIGSKTTFNWSIQRRNLSGKLYYAGLPIIISENDSNRKLFNGDIGLVVPIGESSNSELRAIFAINNQLVSFALDTLPKHEHAYFLTVHKSQGSEYDNLLFYLPPETTKASDERNNQLSNRQIVYTAITRAKKQVFLACEGDSWNTALQNSLARITGFKL